MSSDPRRLREVLDAAGYAEPTVLAALGLPRLPDARGMERRMLLHRTRGGSPLETLVRLLLLGEPVDEPAFLSAWRRRRSPTGRAPAWSRRTVTSSVRCCGCDRTAGCFSPTTPLAARASRCRPTSSWGWATARSTDRVALDLGTGCGVQALLAAPHSDTVVAADRNPRAVALATFNAALNAVASVECRLGDLLAPVAGERFDLIVSNPPFVISPDRSYVYRDAEVEGDSICREVVRQGAGHLAEGRRMVRGHRLRRLGDLFRGAGARGVRERLDRPHGAARPPRRGR
ncbi:MAG: methyltransferase [Chloroflexi bacterium]|nr:MAG: methyltransferase [Chloroflexota bacterium]